MCPWLNLARRADLRADVVRCAHGLRGGLRAMLHANLAKWRKYLDYFLMHPWQSSGHNEHLLPDIPTFQHSSLKSNILFSGVPPPFFWMFTLSLFPWNVGMSSATLESWTKGDITIEEVWVWNAMCGNYIKQTSAEVCWFAAECAR